MKLSQVGVQLYTVRDHLKDASEFARTLDRLKAIGYSAVELVHSETVSDNQIAQICHSAGMTVAAAHIPGQVITKNPEAVAETLRLVGARIGVYAFPSGVDMGSRPAVEQLADQLEQCAAYLNQALRPLSPALRSGET